MDLEFILISDSFKGTLSSSQICAMVDEKIKEHFPDSRTVSIPVADEGEGSVDVFITAVGGIREYITAKDPYFEDIESYLGLMDGGQVAVIETASCVGFPLIEGREDPRLTTTYGVGQLILVVAGKGVEKIVVGLGGSSINGGDCGVAAAAGIRFYDRGDREFIPAGGITTGIDKIDLSGRDSLLEQMEIITMCDIDNPMYEPAGASFIFDPQKGADEAIVLQLDKGIRNLSRVIAQATGAGISQVPRTGAAEAMGAGMIASFSSRLQVGIQTVLDTVKFDEIIGGADYVLTGEGKLDSQGLRGKVVIEIAERANKQVRAVIAMVDGADDGEIGRAYDMGVTTMPPINRLPQDLSVSRHRSQENLAYVVDNIIRLIKAGRGEH